MIEIRRIKSSEVNEFKQIRLRSLKDSPGAFSTRYEDSLFRSEDSWSEQVVCCSSGKDRSTFLCFDNACVVGITSLYRYKEKTDIGELLQVWVDPKSRGNGLATRLLFAALKWGKSNSFTKIIATISATNFKVTSFYELHGFRRIEKSDATNEDVVLYIEL